MKRDIAKELYKFYRSGFKKFKNTNQQMVGQSKLTDPQSLQSVLSEVIAGRNWGQGVAEGNLFSNWAQVVGDEIAHHTTPISLVDGRLTIQSSSSAWATQMRLMQQELLKTISNSAPGALVEELNVIGPHAPSASIHPQNFPKRGAFIP
jgi:predicted nucleic acid-binding Zn ribbon protein